ncbi:hypothetical protein [Acidiphilium sp. JA12-A1]|uniref:hypothetical protein n=1 Tax=Acidiphilium sp. JA12-A1 TaxID=1464546 RepID=UPI000460C9F4|nr:hypothetical protein [Acidiphilium sp. JA12-A1]KDM68392.1 hypothetical protein ACIDI_5c00030 [Acidiphilium sp. JA12-A1]
MTTNKLAATGFVFAACAYACAALLIGVEHGIGWSAAAFTFAAISNGVVAFSLLCT